MTRLKEGFAKPVEPDPRVFKADLCSATAQSPVDRLRRKARREMHPSRDAAGNASAKEPSLEESRKDSGPPRTAHAQERRPEKRPAGRLRGPSPGSGSGSGSGSVSGRRRSAPPTSAPDAGPSPGLEARRASLENSRTTRFSHIAKSGNAPQNHRLTHRVARDGL
ncbi:hypothetical protein M885DRAFT_503691 [Pelagophyceae sp. CCMP2097]|nr:hypothetical protein M885DRAFT_503691 [Pelagophyceae sp. CCMP2097]